ncbi:hypothetical protein [Amycolatopsis taiwanensis]|uniref:hypothetical protein n=1 Tax=Amycolatopsis taiwanensis TaxID=342230 RepID=UPI0012EBECB9|nr:hypothetical protein [Amycolatopsis taiwanensis]
MAEDLTLIVVSTASLIPRRRLGRAYAAHIPSVSPASCTICTVIAHAWLSSSDQLSPGTELYSSDRTFRWYDYTPSHSQLLLRSDGSADRTRVDVLFKPVDVMKVRSHYRGLRIRCATPAEQVRVQAETPEAGSHDPAGDKFDQGYRYFVLETAEGGFDYIVARAVGWHEDHDLGEPSYFADPSGGSASWSPPPKPRWAQTPLDGVTGGLGTPMATVDELVDAIRTTGNLPAEDRFRYRYIHVLTARHNQQRAGDTYAIGAFLTRDEAERQQQEMTDRYPDFTYTINAVPIGI